MSKWDIDATHSTVGFTIRHLVISKVRGHFTTFSGSAEFPESGFEGAKVSASVDLGSIDTAESKRDGHLKSADFFDVEKFPTMTFESSKVEAKGDKLEIHGTLTIKGIAKTVVLHAESNGRAKDPWGGERAGFSAKTSISRGEFGLTWNQVLEAGGVMVGDKVEIEIEAQLVKKS